MLVVDRRALQRINLLHFAHDIPLHSLFAGKFEELAQIRMAFRQKRTALNLASFFHEHA